MAFSDVSTRSHGFLWDTMGIITLRRWAKNRNNRMMDFCKGWGQNIYTPVSRGVWSDSRPDSALLY